MSPAESPTPIDYKALVQDDRIHASLYTDPRIFADEMDRIFHAGWVFAGHDSEIPRIGDFVTRTLGREPVIMVRCKDGEVAVLVNRCMHRGTLLCPADRGHVRTFACPYHGWTYDLSGDLLEPRPPRHPHQAAADRAALQPGAGFPHAPPRLQRRGDDGRQR
jgi:fatty-acyl-CoA synthase